MTMLRRVCLSAILKSGMERVCAFTQKSLARSLPKCLGLYLTLCFGICAASDVQELMLFWEPFKECGRVLRTLSREPKWFEAAGMDGWYGSTSIGSGKFQTILCRHHRPECCLSCCNHFSRQLLADNRPPHTLASSSIVCNYALVF